MWCIHTALAGVLIIGQIFVERARYQKQLHQSTALKSTLRLLVIKHHMLDPASHTLEGVSSQEDLQPEILCHRPALMHLWRLQLTGCHIC